MIIKVEISGEDITSQILTDNFPRTLRRRAKKSGFFSFATQSFAFIVFDPAHRLSLTRNTPCIVYLGGVVRINGFISKIENETSDTPKITIQPNIARLKDVKVGDLKDDADEKSDRLFKSDGYQTIKEIATSVLANAGEQLGISYPTPTEEEIPTETNMPKLGLVGGKLRHIEVGADKLIKALVSLVLPLVSIDQSGAHFRRKNNLTYYVEEGAGFGSRLWIQKHSLINWTFAKTWTILGVSFGFDFGSFQVPSEDWMIPTFRAYYHVYKCESGALEKETTHEWYTVWPFAQGEPNMDQHYGGKLNDQSSSNITDEEIEEYCDDELAIVPESIEIKFMWDLDDINTYVILSGRRTNETIADWYLLSFQTPFDDKFKVHYKNATAITILKDLSIAGFRYLYIDGENHIRMPGRDTITTDAGMPSAALKTEKINREKLSGSASVQISRYEQDSDGKVSTFGIYMSKNEKEELDKYYKDLWDEMDLVRTAREYIAHLVDTPELLQQIDGDTIIEIEEPIRDGDNLKIKTERLETNAFG